MLRAAAIFRDHMVLQCGTDIRVFGEADAPVTVTLAGHSATAVPEDGRFCAVLPPLAPGGPHSLQLECGADELVLRDVMLGEVWLCGGQSNMELALRDARDGAEEAASAADGLLRFYTVPVAATEEEAREKEAGTSWISAEQGAPEAVSAVAYFAGRRLREKLGVPVGMVVCCLGGTEISSWIPLSCLSGSKEGREQIEAFRRSVQGITDEMYAQATREYEARLYAYWDASEALKRRCPGISQPMIERELGPYPWPPPSGRLMPRRPGGLWEGMTSRIEPFPAAGLFWYQGESDSGHAAQYASLFRQLIASWRDVFRQTLALIACQLPGYAADPAAEDWPGIRAAQEQVCDTVKDCYLACLLDCGEKDNLHPMDKRTPGSRLAELALEHVYGRASDADAPRLLEARWADGEAELKFSVPLGPLRGMPESLRINGLPCTGVRVQSGALYLEAPRDAVICYAMENAPEPFLFGENGLPVFPFRTEMKTIDNHSSGDIKCKKIM